MPPTLDINRRIAIRPQVVRKRALRILGAFFTTLVVIALLAAAGYAGHLGIRRALRHPAFVIRKLLIKNTGVRTITDNEIKMLAGITPGLNIYATSLEPITKRLETSPDIRSVSIAKQHPDTLVISITEREPVAVIVTDSSQPDIPIDRDGVMLSERKMEHALHLPKLTGLDNVRYRPGARITDPRAPVAMRFADAIRQIQERDFLTIRAIRLDQPDDIVIQTSSIDTIRIGTDYSNEKVLKLLKVLESLRDRRINAKAIDLRFNDVVVLPFTL